MCHPPDEAVPIPALTGLANLHELYVEDNLLTGNVPPVPSPTTLEGGGAILCRNFLNHTPDPARDDATGRRPWYTDGPGALSSNAIPTLSDAALLLVGVLLIAFGFGTLRARSGRAPRY